MLNGVQLLSGRVGPTGLPVIVSVWYAVPVLKTRTLTGTPTPGAIAVAGPQRGATGDEALHYRVSKQARREDVRVRQVGGQVGVRALSRDTRDVGAVLVSVGVAVGVTATKRVLVDQPVAVVVKAAGRGRRAPSIRLTFGYGTLIVPAQMPPENRFTSVIRRPPPTCH